MLPCFFVAPWCYLFGVHNHFFDRHKHLFATFQYYSHFPSQVIFLSLAHSSHGGYSDSDPDTNTAFNFLGPVRQGGGGVHAGP